MREKENSSPVGTLLFLLALLFILIALIVTLRSCSKTQEIPPGFSPTPEQAVTEQPVAEEPEPSQTAAPVQTAVPTATPQPTPTPNPTPTPTPTPEPEAGPAAEITAKGSFSSDTGTGLNIVVDWSVQKAEEGFAVMDVILYVDSMRVNVSSIYNGAKLTINGEEFVFTTPVLKLEGDAPLKSELCKTHVRLAYSGEAVSVPIEAVWSFNGAYSGVELKKISASGQADIP